MDKNLEHLYVSAQICNKIRGTEEDCTDDIKKFMKGYAEDSKSIQAICEKQYKTPPEKSKKEWRKIALKAISGEVSGAPEKPTKKPTAAPEQTQNPAAKQEEPAKEGKLEEPNKE